ncbi:MAG: NAD(P)/FAD-dependent oxidoreductase [Candidatus Omnitrophota bacterium]
MDFKYTIIGAGVVGLAISRALSLKAGKGNSVLLLEKDKTFGSGISSRNSEVIHSGVYYLNASLKHKLCLKGRRMLYDYCRDKSIPFLKCGKLIIATDADEEPELEKIFIQSQVNGVENVVRLSRAQALRREPDINVHAALLSSETGIIDSHRLMRSLADEAVDNGAILAYNSQVVSIRPEKNRYRLRLQDGTLFSSEFIINSAGLCSVDIAKLLSIPVPKMFPCKGDYFYYSGEHKLRHLVYPIPNKELTGLGVHATFDMSGKLKFGPDAEYTENVSDFSVDERKKGQFCKSASKLLRNIDLNKIIPDMSGIRPKIQGPEDRIKDFYIREESGAGFKKFINLIGIESPGLTSSLALGQYVSKLAGLN